MNIGSSSDRGTPGIQRSVRAPVLVLRLVFLAALLSPSLLLAGIQNSDFATAEELYAAGRIQEAERSYAQVAVDDANYPSALLRLGTIYYITGRPALAEEAFTNYLKVHESAEVCTLLAGAQFNLRKFDQAYASAKQALHLDPRYAKAYTSLGMIYTAIGDWPDAEAAYHEALRLNPKDSDIWFMMGRGYFLRNEFAKAKECFETSLKLSPQRMRNYENLALTLEVTGDDAGADRVLREGREANRTLAQPEPRILIAYGVFLFKHQRDSESVAAFREALKISPQDSEAHYELARALFHMKHLGPAAEEGEAALRSSADDYKIHYLLSRIYNAMGKTELATRHADSAARLADRKPKDSP